MNIAVFCSARDLDERYIGPTKKLVRLFARDGHSLVFGGSDKGLMKIVADEARKFNAQIVGISFEHLRTSIRKDVDEVIVTKDLGARKAKIIERSDAFIVLPGGLGTLDEVTEIMELKKHGLHEKRLVIFNIEDFYTGLHGQLIRMEKEGFLPMPLSDIVTFAKTPEETYATIAKG